MSMKFKILGLGLLAILATSAFAVVNAGATTGGHFIFSHHHVNIIGEEGPEHHVHFLAEGGAEGERIGCEVVKYHGTHKNDAATPTTTTSVTVTPTWENCYTTGTPNTKFDVHENGCHLSFTVRPLPETNHNTVHFICPVGKAVVITHPNCEITVGAQTPTGGVLYKTMTINGVHAITLVSTATIATQYHGGICVFLGTNHTATMNGSATVRATDVATGAASGITAT